MEKISKNLYKGELITNPTDFIRLANECKSVFHVLWGVKPAAFILSQQLRFVINQINQHKFFYTYK